VPLRGVRVYLTREEEKILEGEMGEAARIAMEAVVRVGESLGAERLVEISRAHISGISYKNVGEAGRQFIERLRRLGAKFSVPTTVNPAGMDTCKWRSMGVGEEFARAQLALLEDLEAMGAELILTCTPYFYVELRAGDHLAWSESNAVLYANSVIGARTNREGGPLALLEGLVGRAPYVGLHLDEEREPTVLVDVRGARGIDPALVGYAVGYYVEKGIPYVTAGSFKSALESRLKEFLAAVGASSSIGLVLIEGISPEAPREPPLGTEKISLDEEEVREVKERISTPLGEPDAILLGCPHLSAGELLEIHEALAGRRLRRRLVLFTSRKAIAERMREVRALEALGVEVYADTCMVVSELSKMGIYTAVVDSAKAAYYLSSQGYEVELVSREEALRMLIGNNV